MLKIVTVSGWMRNEMSDSFLKRCNFQVIHNGIDLNLFCPIDGVAIKEKYGIPAGKYIILGVASIWSKEKGWDDFMQMSRMIGDDEVIVLVGIDEKQKQTLPTNIVGIARTESVEQLAQLYSVADVFVNPTWQDNYPTVNLEAIACGTPVVTYRTGGSVEAITPQTGVIVEQGDVKGLLEAVRGIEQRGKEYYRAGCRAFAEEHFDKNKCYAEYLDLYEQMISNKE